MAKEKEQEQEQQAATGTVAPESPVILRAKSREDLDTQLEELKGKNGKRTLLTGSVARSKDDGSYILRVDIID